MAKRYKQLNVEIWSDKKFRVLSERARLVFVFVLTHPHSTSIGAMRATIEGLAREYGVSLKAFRKAVKELTDCSILDVDEDAGLVVIRNFMEHNPPQSPNVVKSWDRLLPELPECDLLTEHLVNVATFLEGLSEGFRKALPEGFRKALPEGFGKGMPNTYTITSTYTNTYEEPIGSSCSEPVPDSEPPEELPLPVGDGPGDETYLVFPVVRGANGTSDHWGLTQAQVDKWVTSYGEYVDVKLELHKAHQWCEANKSKRKTAQGMPKFLVTWLNKAVDNGRSQPPAKSGPKPQGPKPEYPGHDPTYGGFFPNGLRYPTPEEVDAVLVGED